MIVRPLYQRLLYHKHIVTVSPFTPLTPAGPTPPHLPLMDGTYCKAPRLATKKFLSTARSSPRGPPSPSNAREGDNPSSCGDDPWDPPRRL
jgi:hypothetical protein